MNEKEFIESADKIQAAIYEFIHTADELRLLAIEIDDLHLESMDGNLEPSELQSGCF